MTRPLAAVSASDPRAVLEALRVALTNDAPAVFPTADAGPGVTASAVMRSATPPPPASVAQRIAVVVETSGSSGRPKRVALTADALLASAAASDTALGGPGQWLLALPAHYIAGINVLVRSIAAQTEPVMLTPGHFDPVEFVERASGMDASAPRYTSLVPAQLARLLEHPSPADVEVLRSFDRILVGGQSSPAELVLAAADLGLRVTRTYGSSETCGGCVYDGVALAGVRAEVVDGQIELAGPMLAEGYLDENFTADVERTDAAFGTRDSIRWYRTGDTGILTEATLAVTGRRDRVIISGGLKVALDDIERTVRELSGHADAVAVPLASAKWGQSVALIVTSGVDHDDIRMRLTSRLGPAAAPALIVHVERMPRLTSGKLDLVALTALASASASPR